MEEQDGKFSAEYGKRQIYFLSENLKREFDSGYSSYNLWYFRQIYPQYSIFHVLSEEYYLSFPKILHAVSGEMGF